MKGEQQVMHARKKKIRDFVAQSQLKNMVR